MIYQGLDEDEAVFLKRIADQKAAHNAEVAMIETEELSEFRVSPVVCCTPQFCITRLENLVSMGTLV